MSTIQELIETWERLHAQAFDPSIEDPAEAVGALTLAIGAAEELIEVLKGCGKYSDHVRRLSAFQEALTIVTAANKPPEHLNDGTIPILVWRPLGTAELIDSASKLARLLLGESK